MIVCVCRRISDHQIHQAVADGAQTLECLQFDLGVATQCGRCADCASRSAPRRCSSDACNAMSSSDSPMRDCASSSVARRMSSVTSTSCNFHRSAIRGMYPDDACMMRTTVTFTSRAIAVEHCG